MTRYLFGFMCVLALGLMGCSETTGAGGSGGSAGDGGSGGDGGGAGGIGGAGPCEENTPCAADEFGGITFCDDSGNCVRECTADYTYTCEISDCVMGQSCNVATGMCEGAHDLPKGTPCGSYGGKVCNSSGDCVECNEDLHCNDFNDCTIDTCDSAHSECNESSLAMDGTPCAGGTCQAGQCALGGTVLPCSEQGIRNAIAEGGGPYTFDCDGPTIIATQALLVFDNNVILDGQGNITLDGGDSYAVIKVEREVAVELSGFGITGGAGQNVISNEGLLLLIEASVFGNSPRGSVIMNNNARMEIVGSTLHGNTTEGSILSNFRAGMMTITNSTVSGNIGDHTIWTGGNSYLGAGMLTLAGSTVSVPHDADIRAIDSRSGAITSINTIVDGDCLITRLTQGDPIIELVSVGGNIESPGNTCGFDQPTDQVNVSSDDLKLGPLQDNGGPTETHALGAGSAAIDQIPADDCVDADGAPLTTDQRGEPRDSMCDVGAFEVQP